MGEIQSEAAGLPLKAQRLALRLRGRTLAWRRPRKALIEVSVDAGAWAVGLFFAYATRLDWNIAKMHAGSLETLAVTAIALQVAAGSWTGLYRGGSRYGSFDEVFAVVRTVLLVGAIVELLDLVTGGRRLLPLSVPPGGAVAALLVMMGVRCLFRAATDRNRRPRGDGCERLLVFGAGEGAAQVIAALMRSPTSPYVPVVLLDDDRRKRNLRIMGVPVVGTRHDITAAAERYAAKTMLIAIPSAGADLVRDLTAVGAAAGLVVKVLPAVGELIAGSVQVADIRTPTVEDLMGRRELDTDVSAIASYLHGKRVLVTGAGGSIGSELCRQICRFGPETLVMLDRDESALHAVQLSINGSALMDSETLALVDIRDAAALGEAFLRHQPEVVFHAAALKHLTLLEATPAEAVKTNVWGTGNVLDASVAAGVRRFVNISTDKAADPCSVLGFSKRIAERLTAHVASTARGVYLSVRFGNVLGTRGSVLSTFKAQIANGGPVTVTDPEVTRYFMTIEEAVQLVIQAGAVGNAGEALVLDMGAPVRIADIARQMVDGCGQAVEIIYTELRPGEKLHETLLAADELDRRPRHPMISHVGVPPLAPTVAAALDVGGPPAQVRSRLEQLCWLHAEGASRASAEAAGPAAQPGDAPRRGA